MLAPPPLFQLVVVGSSAGGIEALSTLVATLPASFAVPLVIAQHLDPNRPSHLGAILARRSLLPVVTVDQAEPLRPATIYVVPANRHVEISDHAITLLPDGAGALVAIAEQQPTMLLTTFSGLLGSLPSHGCGGTTEQTNLRTAPRNAKRRNEQSTNWCIQ